MAVDSDQLIRIAIGAAAVPAIALVPLLWEAIKELTLLAWRRHRTRSECNRASKAIADAIHGRRVEGEFLGRDDP